jgi:hypothetical protein
MLRYALHNTGRRCWDVALDMVVRSGNLECVKVMYNKGCQQHRSAQPD